MKHIIIIALLIAGLVFYIANKDPFPTSLHFYGEDYKLGQNSGKKGMAKTYQYTKSGAISGLNDFVQIIVVDKSNDYIEPIKSNLVSSYKLKPLDYSSDQFGIFRVPSEQRDFFAYLIERETPTSHWILTFVIQSNFGNNTLSSDDARKKAKEYTDSLELVFNQISH